MDKSFLIRERKKYFAFRKFAYGFYNDYDNGVECLKGSKRVKIMAVAKILMHLLFFKKGRKKNIRTFIAIAATAFFFEFLKCRMKFFFRVMEWG